MKTAISLPDPLFDEAERVAARLEISRSQLYARALEEYVRRWRSDEIREAYDRIYGEEPEDPEDAAFLRAAAREAAKRSEW